MKRTTKLLLLPVICLLALPAAAQHEQHQSMQHEQMHMPMSHAFSCNLPMNRNVSGTGWLPDESPMYGNMKQASNRGETVR